MSDIETALRSHVDNFVSQLSVLVREQALEAVAAALGQAPAAPRKAAAKPAPAAKAPIAKRGPGRPPKAPKRAAGQKRPPEELAKLVDQTAEYIKANPGQGVEQISKGMNTSTKELTLPIKKLLADKKITSKGQKRATKYFPR